MIAQIIRWSIHNRFLVLLFTALLVAGGMEATFDPETLFQMAPIDLVVLGEGEFPLLEMLDALLPPPTGLQRLLARRIRFTL